MKISDIIGITGYELKNAILSEMNSKSEAYRLLGASCSDRGVKIFENDLGEHYDFLCDMLYRVDSFNKGCITCNSTECFRDNYAVEQYIIPGIHYMVNRSIQLKSAEFLSNTRIEGSTYYTFKVYGDITLHSNIGALLYLGAKHTVERMTIVKYGDYPIDYTEISMVASKINRFSIDKGIVVYDSNRISNDATNTELKSIINKSIKDDKILKNVETALCNNSIYVVSVGQGEHDIYLNIGNYGKVEKINLLSVIEPDSVYSICDVINKKFLRKTGTKKNEWLG